MSADRALRPEDLERLGLDPTLAGGGFLLDPTPPGESRGETAFPALAELEEDAPLEVLDEGPLAEALARSGWHLSRFTARPSVLHLSGGERVDVLQRFDPEDVAAAAAFHQEPDAVLIDQHRFRGLRQLRGSDARADLLVRGTSDGRLGVLLLHSPIEVAPLPELSSDALAWAKGEPTWLREEVERLCACRDPLREAEAVGLLARLRQRTPEQSRALVEATLAGRHDPEADRERAWARGWSPAQCEAVETLALVAADRLRHELLDVLEGEASPREPQVGARLRDVLLARDRLQGVLVLLREAGAGHRLGAVLEPLDQEALVSVEALGPLELLRIDPQLTEVAALEPELWWVLPAAPADE